MIDPCQDECDYPNPHTDYEPTPSPPVPVLEPKKHCLYCQHHAIAPQSYPVCFVGCKVNAQKLKPTVRYTPVVLGVGSASKITDTPDYFDPADLIGVCGRFGLKDYRQLR